MKHLGMQERWLDDLIDQMRVPEGKFTVASWFATYDPILSVQNCSSGFILPPTLDILEESWWELDLLRFWFFLLLAALTDRRSNLAAWRRPPWMAVLTEAHVVPRGRSTSRDVTWNQGRGTGLSQEEMKFNLLRGERAQRSLGKANVWKHSEPLFAGQIIS